MPKLSKIRLTGCKYDGLKKEHENSVFDLSKNSKADHCLFTLCNGGGKGVMMQLLFQILLPETRWGKNNGNKIISMFYDKRSNLYPFTFHVALEWILDTVPEKRLITGIAVKAIIKNTSNDEEEKTGLSYFLYTHEHDNNGYFSIETLPLYDNNSKEVTDINVLDNFITENRRDFIKYSQSSVRRIDSDYYRYLESRGIYRSEWINLKDINKQEGGAGDYFVGASDNKSIFDKIIIPAISENINNYSYDHKDNLIEMFRSNLSITKDLPVLIKREGDYKSLLIEIKPLIENADIGSRLIDFKERLTNEGNDIYFILKDEELLVNKEIDKWDKEFERSIIEKEELEYKKENLRYNQLKKDIESKEKEAKGLDVKLEDKAITISEKKEESTFYQINKLLYFKKDVENEISSKVIGKENLLKALDISDISARAELLDNEIELEWDKTRKIWINVENQYSAYKNHANQIKEENKNKKKRYQVRIDGLQNEVNRFIIKEEDLANKRRKLEETYDSLSLLYPERIYDDLVMEQAEAKLKIDHLSNELKMYYEKTAELDKEIVTFKYILDNKNKDIESLGARIIEQERYEIGLSRKIVKQLLENLDGSLLSHDWFNKKLDKLEQVKNEKNDSLESIQRIIWEKSLDKVLNREDYFIPNKDIVILKEEIYKAGINVQTGAEYLNEVDEKSRLSLLNNNPGFLYSLVIGNLKDWEIIHKNISKDLFINNMVPVYIRSEMKGHSTAEFKIIKGKAYDLVNRGNYTAWKADMVSEIENLIQTQDNIKKDICNIDQIIQEVKIINTKDTVLILNRKINEEKIKTSDLLEETRITEEERSSINNKISSSENILSSTKEILEEKDSAFKKIKEYIEDMQDLERVEKEIVIIKDEIKEFKNEIVILDEDNNNLSENLDIINDSYREWKIAITSITNSVRDVYKDLLYDYEEGNSYVNFKTPDFIIAADRLNSLSGERKVIEKDIAAKNTSIAVLDTEIKNLEKDSDRYIKELKGLSINWAEYEYLGLSLDDVNIIINEIKRNIESNIEEQAVIKSVLDTIRGSIMIIKEQLFSKESEILKEYKKAPVVLELEDINSEINLVERNIKSNKVYLDLCHETLEKNKSNKMKLEINLSRIKNGYSLELRKGKTNDFLKDKLKENSNLVVDEWLRKCENNQGEIRKAADNGELYRNRFIKAVGNKLEENKLKEKITTTVKEANIVSFKNNLTSFNSMENHFQKELLRLENDKGKAEEVMKQWTHRASIHVIRMIEALKDMVSSMNYTNEQGYSFPLVKLKGIERLPKEESEIAHLLDEYFIQSISRVLEKEIDISNIADRELKDLMGDKVIFSKALQGRYPTLLVYKMSEKNEFRYARARDEYYTTWEAINKGEGDLPEGSGGQTLSVNTFVIMMIMSFKKKHLGNENPSTVLMLDNPFGKASAKHVLDPIFEIADKLNFQLICFAAPEIIKVEISERFPVFWELKIEDGKVVHGGRIIRR